MPRSQTQASVPAAAAVKASEVARAAKELARMKRSLRAWLRYRALNDQILSGQLVPRRLPPGLAKKTVLASRDMEVEQGLADRLHVLLTEVMPEAHLPSPNVRANPDAAPQLAQIALTGEAPRAQPLTQGSVWSSLPPWPVLVVAGVLILAVTAIHSYADVAKERERYACIKSGACTDYGFWLKVGGAVAVGWFAWTKLGVGQAVQKKWGGGSRALTRRGG